MVHLVHRLLPCAWLAMTLALAGPAHAQDEARHEAAKAFSEGEKAFARKDYPLAARRFEEAYRLAPHPSATWNEARALQHAGEKARAANAYAKYLRDAAPDAHDRSDAARELEGLGKQLVQVRFDAPGFDVVLIDDQRVEETSVYVDPGRHIVEGRAGEQVLHVETRGEAGAVVPVSLRVPEPPTPTPLPTPTPTPTPTPLPTPTPTPLPTPPPPAPPSGWSPAVVWVGAGVTALATAATVWSGVDTLSFRSGTYDSNQTTANYDTGRDKMHRTNALLSVSVVSAAFTGIAAIWLVDWHGAGETHTGFAVTPGSLELTGAFR